jgi:hypothetical protein
MGSCLIALTSLALVSADCGGICSANTQCVAGKCEVACQQQCCQIGGGCPISAITQCVCDFDSYCCSDTGIWDNQCRDEAVITCGLTCDTALCPTETSTLSVPTIRTRCSDDTTTTSDQKWQGKQYNGVKMALETSIAARTIDGDWAVVGTVTMTDEMLAITSLEIGETFVAEVDIAAVLYVLSFAVESVDSTARSAVLYCSESDFTEVQLACDFDAAACDVAVPATSTVRRLLQAASLIPGGTAKLLRNALPQKMARKERRLEGSVSGMEFSVTYIEDKNFEFTVTHDVDEVLVVYCCLYPPETSGSVDANAVIGGNYECDEVGGYAATPMDDKGTNYFGVQPSSTSAEGKTLSYSTLDYDTTYHLYCHVPGDDLQSPISYTTNCVPQCDRCLDDGDCYDCASGYCLNEDPASGCSECECIPEDNTFADCSTQPDNPTATTVSGLGNYDGCSITCSASFDEFNVREDSAPTTCFPGDAFVSTPTGPKPIAALRPLDMVLSVSSDQGGRSRSKFERVWWITHTHEDQSSKHKYLRLSLASGHVLELSPEHLVYVDGCCSSQHARPASSVTLGDTIFTAGSDRTVSASKVNHVDVVYKKGKFSVFVTESMAIVVNGVVASSLTDDLRQYKPVMQVLGFLMGLAIDFFQSVNRLVGQVELEEIEELEKQTVEVIGRVVDFAFWFIQGDHYPGVVPLFLAFYIPVAIFFDILLGLRLVLLISPASVLCVAVACMLPRVRRPAMKCPP